VEIAFLLEDHIANLIASLPLYADKIDIRDPRTIALQSFYQQEQYYHHKTNTPFPFAQSVIPVSYRLPSDECYNYFSVLDNMDTVTIESNTGSPPTPSPKQSASKRLKQSEPTTATDANAVDLLRDDLTEEDIESLSKWEDKEHHTMLETAPDDSLKTADQPRMPPPPLYPLGSIRVPFHVPYPK